MNDGSRMEGSIDAEDIKTVLDSKTTFLEVYRPDGNKILIHKGYLAYVFPDSWDWNNKE